MAYKNPQQDELFSLPERSEQQGPVECLGMTFESDEARRAYFIEQLRAKLQDPEFRKIEGFPIGEDEDILRLSDPPYYTACPNPFLPDIIAYWQSERAVIRSKLNLPIESLGNGLYHREPFVSDVSEGKNDPIYTAHTYHTKVPHKAIMRYILHYTDPGDIVLDGFSGTGMTGIAAQLCGDKFSIQEIDYHVDNQGIIHTSFYSAKALNDKKVKYSQLGSRFAVLSDICPIATFISYNYNSPIILKDFEIEANRILSDVENEYGWMYQTLRKDNATKGHVYYIVWSTVFICPTCSQEMTFWDVGIEYGSGITKYEFQCPSCQSISHKGDCEYSYEMIYDPALRTNIRKIKQKPVWINYQDAVARDKKSPGKFDTDLLLKIENKFENELGIFPSIRMPEGDESRRNDPFGITHTHHFYTKRNLICLSEFWKQANSEELPPRIRHLLSFWMTSIIDRNAVIRNRFVVNRHNPYGRINGPMQNTLYCPDLFCEVNIIDLLRDKLNDITSGFRKKRFLSTAISTGSSEILSIPDNSIDYIFVDPPFGHNIWYSELNFITEAWLRVRTNNNREGVVNNSQKKGLSEYQEILEKCFTEYYRILKPGRWITTEFHNSKNSVWIAIQEAIRKAGFVIANVSTLDKIQGTIHQDTSAGSVKQDLIISAYKPDKKLEDQFRLTAGTEEGCWEFVRAHLEKLPNLPDVHV